MHPCDIVYRLSGSGIVYGETPGVCRITGNQSEGVPFENWVKDTFNDYAFLRPGDIISNESLFCFDEQSDFLMRKTGRDKPQRFRTYSHIVKGNDWYCLTKADKQQIFELIVSGAEIVSLTDTGQKHVFFKHKIGFWQLDDLYIVPNIPAFHKCHGLCCDLLRCGFSQGEIIENSYKFNRIELAGLDRWKSLESELKAFRGSGIFKLATWMLFISENDKIEIQNMYDNAKEKKALAKKEIKQQIKPVEKEKEQMSLW